MKVREDLFTAGFRPRLATPMLLAILGRLKDREQSSACFPKPAIAPRRLQDSAGLREEVSCGAKGTSPDERLQRPIDAYRFLEKLPLDQMAYLLAESSNSAALSKIRAYLQQVAADPDPRFPWWPMSWKRSGHAAGRQVRRDRRTGVSACS